MPQVIFTPLQCTTICELKARKGKLLMIMFYKHAKNASILPLNAEFSFKLSVSEVNDSALMFL